MEGNFLATEGVETSQFCDSRRILEEAVDGGFVQWNEKRKKNR